MHQVLSSVTLTINIVIMRSYKLQGRELNTTHHPTNRMNEGVMSLATKNIIHACLLVFLWQDLKQNQQEGKITK